MGRVYTHDTWGNLFVYESVKLTVFYLLWLAALFGYRSFLAFAAERQRFEQAQLALKEAQVQRLQQQLQPHFLFNTLNLISSTMHVDAAQADRLLTRLADLLRASLRLSDTPYVSLADELAVLRTYAEIMEARFSDRVHVVWRVSEDALGCRVPSLLLQPLLENVFKHTVERRSDPVTITVEAGREAQFLALRISDDGGELPAAMREGMGLRQTRERLAALYGEEASLRLDPALPRGVSCRVRLPCEP